MTGIPDMRAMVITGYDRDLELVRRPRPTPGPGLALVQVLTCGICFSDVKTARGHMPYSAKLRLPHVAGHEICGRIIALNGPAGVGVGDRVVLYHVWACRRCASCRRGDEQLCLQPTAWMGFTEPGGFQEYLTVPIEYLLPIPDNIPDRMAPALTCAMGTAYRAVVTRGALVAGEYAVVLGLGGVGIHAALIAQAVGARTLGVEVSEAKVQGALGAGVLMATTSEAAAGRVREDTAGQGADVVIETTGRPAFLETARRLCRPGGRVVCVGYLVDAQMSVSSDQLVLLEQSVLGVRYASRVDMEHVISIVAAGRVRPVVDSVLALTDVNEGLARLESGNVIGRLVLDVAGAQ
ncbi:MAG: alcohol dehydrogenase catalytic domain-containing protein [Candidatus Dormiibacterota bacterium]